MPRASDVLKEQVLRKLAGNRKITRIPRAKSSWFVGQYRINVRFKSGNKDSSAWWDFRRNVTDLDLVCLIYGDSQTWWLLPGHVATQVLDDPEGYRAQKDRSTQFTIDTQQQQARYGPDYCTYDVGPYFQKTIEELKCADLMKPPPPMTLEEML